MTNAQNKPFRNLEDFAGIASDWFWETDGEHRFTYFSSRMEEVTKLDASKLLGTRRDKIGATHSDDAKWQAHLDDLNAHRPFRNFEYSVQRATDGSVLWLRVAGQPLFDADGIFTGYRGTGHDITTEKEAMRQLVESHDTLAERNRELDEARRALERSAYADALTGLLNRRAFERDLAQILKRTSKTIGLLHVDLDRFKWVNDTLGHPAGDAVLIAAARRIYTAVGGAGAVYRVGGDEFMIIITENASPDVANWIGEAVLKVMEAPIIYEQQRASVGASVGIALRDDDRASARRLIADADVALYEAKRSGRNAVRQITKAMQQEIQAHRRLAAEIPRALEDDEFTPFFQPQVNTETGDVIGAEALVRWYHPERGILTPDQFLNAATELGSVAEIDRIMLRKALAFSELANTDAMRLQSVSVNISAARLMDPKLPEDVEGWWTSRDCKLSIELLETIYFDEIQEETVFNRNLAILREMGVRIETDDFGSGRASVTGLLKIKPDRVKVDKSLIQAAIKDPVKRNVVAAILEMARALEIEVMAEGVESEEDVEVIRSLGCHVFQGYAFGRPMDAATFLSSLAPKGAMPIARMA